MRPNKKTRVFTSIEDLLLTARLSHVLSVILLVFLAKCCSKRWIFQQGQCRATKLWHGLEGRGSAYDDISSFGLSMELRKRCLNPTPLRGGGRSPQLTPLTYNNGSANDGKVPEKADLGVSDVYFRFAVCARHYVSQVSNVSRKKAQLVQSLDCFSLTAIPSRQRTCCANSPHEKICMPWLLE